MSETDDNQITTLYAQLDDMEERCDVLADALQEIAGQAVCVNMDGDKGNEQMLAHILGIADAALSAHNLALLASRGPP